jgi:uncharacterized protein (DUF1501 family)
VSNNLPSRRNALMQFAALGAAGPLLLNLSAVGSAAAQSASSSSGYKALVCIFLLGGNDSNNMLLATDQGSFSQYWTSRFLGFDPIALMPPGTAPVAIGQTSSLTKRAITTTSMPEHWGGVLPITPATQQTVPAGNATSSAPQARTFAIHPFLTNTQSLFSAGRLAAIANVGTLLAPLTKAAYLKPTATTLIPQRLFSHADQQSAWQSGQVAGAAIGWGGLIGDTFAAANGTATDYTAITTAGNCVYLSGVTTEPFRVNYAKNEATAETITLLSSTGTYNASSTLLTELRAGVQDYSLGLNATNFLMVDYAAAVTRSINTSLVYDTALGAKGGAYTQVAAPTAFTDPIGGKVVDNPLADQLQAVAETAAAHAALGVTREVFFVQYGSFDTHDNENGRQGLLLAQLDHALGYFDGVMASLGLGDQITAFTASDFNRTFTTNGDGTDHAWGGHHFVMGAAVKGGDIYGAYPTLGIDRAATATTPAFSNPDAVGTSFIPTTPVDAYMATMATWLGVTNAQLATIFPRLSGFPQQNLGFMRT